MGTCFIVSLFWLPHCVCFCVLARSAMSPSLGRVALYSRCLVRPSSAASLTTWAGCSRRVPQVAHVCPPAVVEPGLLLACQWVGLTLRLAGCEGRPLLQQINCYARVTVQSGSCLSGVLVSPSLPSECVTCRTSCVVLWYGLWIAIRCVGSRAS